MRVESGWEQLVEKGKDLQSRADWRNRTGWRRPRPGPHERWETHFVRLALLAQSSPKIGRKQRTAKKAKENYSKIAP